MEMITFVWNLTTWETFWLEEVFWRKGKQKRGRRILLDKSLVHNKSYVSKESMVHLAGVGHEVPAPASVYKTPKNWLFLIWSQFNFELELNY